MKENNIEDFLRENKPRVKDDPTFMLDIKNKMNALDGIKAEVDRSRKTGLLAIIVALIIGLTAGAAASAFILLAPKAMHTSDAILMYLIDFLQTWKQLIYALTVGSALVLGIVLQGKRQKSI